jgi:predicted HNH restriction endonuclease
MKLQRDKFGPTNYGSVSSIIDATAMPYTPTEAEIYGVEGRTLTRIHAYKERDRSLSAKAKKHYRNAWGELHCEACGFKPSSKYGSRGDHCIEAHHKTPVEQLLPDSITRVSDLAMLCASCHRIIHSEKPMLTLGQVVVG